MGGYFAYWGFQVSVPFHQIDCKCSSVETFLSLKATGQYEKMTSREQILTILNWIWDNNRVHGRLYCSFLSLPHKSQPLKGTAHTKVCSRDCEKFQRKDHVYL